MKRTINFFALMIILTAIACKNDPPKEEKREIIVTPPPATAPVVKSPPAKDVTIEVDTNGMKVETKKVGISVNKH